MTKLAWKPDGVRLLSVALGTLLRKRAQFEKWALLRALPFPGLPIRAASPTKEVHSFHAPLVPPIAVPMEFRQRRLKLGRFRSIPLSPSEGGASSGRHLSSPSRRDSSPGSGRFSPRLLIGRAVGGRGDVQEVGRISREHIVGGASTFDDVTLLIFQRAPFGPRPETSIARRDPLNGWPPRVLQTPPLLRQQLHLPPQLFPFFGPAPFTGSLLSPVERHP